MKKPGSLILWVTAAAATLVVFLFAGLVFKNNQAASPAPVMALKAPAFYTEAKAASNSFIGNKLDQEAGISAYFKGSYIDLAQVESLFVVKETQTSDYIIGSVKVPSYSEHYEPHVYVHKDGWILAYYMKDVPASKMVDLASWSINSTILKNIVATVAGTAGIPFTDVTYYDFRYPNATNILLVAEGSDNGDTFTLNIPSTYAYFERSWAQIYASNGCGGSDFWLDSTNLASTPIRYSDHFGYGVISAALLATDTNHKFVVDGWCGPNYGVVVLTYRVP